MPHDDFPPASVWLVGAGPGDPELLTRKAARLIAAAEVIFYDALVGAGVLDLASPAAERISVGKRSGRHSKDQATIDALIVAAALGSANETVVADGGPVTSVLAWFAATDVVPGELTGLTPYVATLLVLGVAAQRLRPPAADGIPYRKGTAA